MECETCKYNIIEMTAPYDRDNLVKYLHQNTAADENDYTLTVKYTTSQSMQEILETVQQTMERFHRRVFNIHDKCRENRSKCNNLDTDECSIHIDLAENYTCWYTKEIQVVR